MSYDRVNPTYYQTFQQDTPFHAGAPGWSTAPWVTWGDNPNLAGRRRLATDGLGTIVAISGLGATNLGPAPAPGQTSVTVGSVWRTLAPLAAAASAYHGYKRTGTVWSALVWGLFGSLLPVVALPVALAQGFGKPKRAAMKANRRRVKRR